MPRGDKSGYTDKQKRQAEHIEESEKNDGRSASASKRIAWATVNKQDGGGKKKHQRQQRRSSTRREPTAELDTGSNHPVMECAGEDRK